MRDLPEIQIRRGGILWPMPALCAAVITERRGHWWWWWPGKYFVTCRLLHRDRVMKIGPFRTYDQARTVRMEMQAWYQHAYTEIIDTYRKNNEKEKNDKSST